MKAQKLVSIVALFGCMAAQADQQQSFQWRQTGTLRIGRGISETVRSVSLTLRSNSEFELVVEANRRDSFSGTYVRFDDGARLEITRGFGSNGANGVATVFFKKQSLSAKGTTKGQEFSIEVGTPGSTPSMGTGRFDHLDRNRLGKGSFRLGNEPTNDASRVEIALKRDGTFDIALRGKKNVRVKGTWQWRGNDVALEVSDAFGDQRATGSGTLFIQRAYENFYRLEINGTAAKGRFNVNWRE